MCLRKLFAPEPREVVRTQTVKMDSPDVAEGQEGGPVTGARRLRSAGSLAGNASQTAKGTEQLRIALSLPGQTGLNIPPA